MRTTPLHKAAMGGHVSEVAQALSSVRMHATHRTEHASTGHPPGR